MEAGDTVTRQKEKSKTSEEDVLKEDMQRDGVTEEYSWIGGK